MKQSSSSPKLGYSSAALVAISGAFMINASSQEILFEENFETDGAGSRYEVGQGDVFSPERLFDELGDNSQTQAVYWSRNTDVAPTGDPVGVEAPTPEKRAVMAWNSGIAEDAVSEEFLGFFGGVVNWLTGGASNPTVLFSPAPSGGGDMALVTYLEDELGAEILEDDEAADPPAPADIDLVIRSSNTNTNPSRFTVYAVPMLTFNAPDHDDELVSSIGQSAQSFEVAEAEINAPDHPAAGGLTGTFQVAEGSQPYDLIGSVIPNGSTVVASFKEAQPGAVTSLEMADRIIAGEFDPVLETGEAYALDFSSGFDTPGEGEWSSNIDVPGDPRGGFVVRALGSVTPESSGPVSFALAADDGARFRIDLDGDGIDEEDTILEVQGAGLGNPVLATVDFPSTDTFDVELVAYNESGDFDVEVSVELDGGGQSTLPLGDDEWEEVSDFGLAVIFEDGAEVTSYVAELPQVLIERPLLVAIEAPEDGGTVFGGGNFAGVDGDGFFAGAGLNKFGETPKTITFPEVDVSGKEDLFFRMLAGATFLDFETSDYLDVWIDPDGSGGSDFEQLIQFTAPSGDDKFFDDTPTSANSHSGETTRLNLQLQEVVYPLPDGVTNPIIEIRAITTWWNEIVAFDKVQLISGAPTSEPTDPNLAISATDDGLVVTWDTAGSIQTAPSVVGPWSDSSLTSPATLQPDGSTLFIRVAN